MMQNPINVSIVVPVYNAEKFIECTIKKLLSQTLEEIEVILVDDGSTDTSGSICDEYAKKDTRIRVFHQKNKGVSAARNTGIRAAIGEYIGFCDADDLPERDLYEYLYRLVKEKKAEVSIVDMYRIENEMENVFESDDFSFYSTDKKEIIKNFLDGRFGEAVYTGLYKKHICKTTVFEEGKRINEDKMYLFECLMKCKSIHYKSVPKYGYNRYEGSSSSMNSFSEKYFDYLYFTEKISERCRKEYPELEDYIKKNEVSSYLRFLTIMSLLKGEKLYGAVFDSIAGKVRNYKVSFCKKYLSRKVFIKWMSLKAGNPIFHTVVRLFAKM